MGGGGGLASEVLPLQNVEGARGRGGGGCEENGFSHQRGGGGGVHNKSWGSVIALDSVCIIFV